MKSKITRKTLIDEVYEESKKMFFTKETLDQIIGYSTFSVGK